VSVDDLIIHCSRKASIPLSVADGTSGYAVLDWQVESAPPGSGYFVDLRVRQKDEFQFWIVDAAVPTAASPQVGPTWTVKPLHFQVWRVGHGPWSVGSCPAIAFSNSSGRSAIGIVSYGRFI
jgi:hypothetical protein